MVKKKKSSVKATKNSKASLRASASLAKAQYGGDDPAVLTFKDSGEGDGSYRLTFVLRCFPDGQGGWICN
jgi:hypothetical protein